MPSVPSVARSLSANRRPSAARAGEPLECGVGLAGAQCHQALGHQEVATFHRVEFVFLDHPTGTRQPATAPGHLATLHQTESQPECAASGTRFVTALMPGVMGSHPRIGALDVVTGQVPRSGEPLEIVGPEWGVPISSQKAVVGVPPGACIERSPCPVEQLGRVHRALPHRRR